MEESFQKEIYCQSFQAWLCQEFTQRCRKNPSYSIRAFAQLLQIDSSSISQMMSGKRAASTRMVQRITERLGVDPKQKEILTRSTQSTRLKTKQQQAKEQEYKQLTLDAYAIVADWYHYAILELSFVHNFKSDVRWISNKLGITASEANIAIERLLRLGLLRKVKNRLIKTDVFLTNFSEGVTSKALKELQKSVLEMALIAIDNIPQEEKDITSMTMAIAPEKLPAAKKKIRKFRREICEFLEKGEQKRVYNLGIQLYPISKV